MSIFHYSSRIRKSFFRSRSTGFVEFSEADAELEETLGCLDDADNYAAWIAKLIEPHLGDEVLEVGAGHGTFTAMLTKSSRRVVATDLSQRCVDVLGQRFDGDQKVEVIHGTGSAAAGKGPFDSVVLINVLEHIEDDADALVELYGLLRPGGKLILWVPAFPMLYSEFDRRIGHFRRYRRSDLCDRLVKAGYDVADIRYVNAVGAVAWLLVARILRRTPTVGAQLKVFDRYVVPALRRIEREHRPPFGQSVLAIAIRPAP